jgi:BON domain
MTPAILALLIFLAVPSYAADSKTAAPKVSAQPSSAQQDKMNEAAIRAKLAKSKIGKDGFTVRVQGGVAYWEGTTTVPQHKGAATRMAHSSGVPNVINNIKVLKTGTTTPVPAAPAAMSAKPVPATTAAATSAGSSVASNVPSVPAAAPAASPESGLRRVQVKPASSQNGPPQ